jgi:DNA-binding phage protein
MKNNLPVYELKINDSLADDSEVSYVALVDAPAIQKDFLIFQSNGQFINPSKGEHQKDFIDRCIKYVIDEGKEAPQAVAICNSLWDNHFAEESYTDYPQAAIENAKVALRWAEKNGWGECGTQVGKIRANQLANNEPISRDTISRMASFDRHRQNADRQLGDGCGRLMWLAWGGDEGIAWAQRKLKEIDTKQFATEKISFDYDGTLSTKRGKELALKLMKEGNTVYIISARSDVNGMTEVASQLGIAESRIYATGSNKAKVEKIKELGINRHYDNNPDVISELGSIGIKFTVNHNFSITNEEQRIISGALMLADELIYRNSPEFGEHYVKFTAETIKQIVIKFSKKKYQTNVNLMHNDNMKVDGVTMIESFITDRNRGIQPIKGFEDVADGSWFGSYYVENDDVWDMIKQGNFKGFSVEGLFEMVEAKAFINNEDDEVFEILSQINNIINKNKKK